MKDIKLKICGIVPGVTGEGVKELADWLGFIFYEKSPRYVDPTTHEKIRSLKGIQKVGVFVDEQLPRVIELIESTALSLVQLHGKESPAYCRELKMHAQVIKTIPVRDEDDLELVSDYQGSVDYFLFDTRGEQLGGNGIKFNWDLLKDRRFGHPFFLSGGISRQDAAIIRDYEHPELAGIDINSCFEIHPGQKDLALISSFKEDLHG